MRFGAGDPNPHFAARHSRIIRSTGGWVLLGKSLLNPGVLQYYLPLMRRCPQLLLWRDEK